MGPYVIAAFLVLLSGCAAVTEELTAVTSPPNLIGRWKGEWGGNMHHPIEVVVEKQQEGKVSGTMTFFPKWGKVIHTMNGTIGAKPDGTVWANLTVAAPTPLTFPLNVISENRLEGTGRSANHYGPVTLNRE
ncbi:MAG: hypothetical protein ACREKK_05755 [Candidatus Methylomirabilales bacterium]